MRALVRARSELDKVTPIFILFFKCASSQELMNYLVNRGNRLDFLKTQIQRASDVSRNDALKTKPKRQTDTVPIV